MSVRCARYAPVLGVAVGVWSAGLTVEGSVLTVAEAVAQVVADVRPLPSRRAASGVARTRTGQPVIAP